MISTSTAREIAAQWQSLGAHGIGMAQFASSGTVTEALLNDISREVKTAGSADLVELCSLSDYVNAQTVTVWTVGSNTAGYLPESDVSQFLDYSDALTEFEDMIRDAPDGFCPDGCECDEESAEMCDHCSTDSVVSSFIRDECPSVIGSRVFGEPRELSIALRPDHLPLPKVYWLARTEMTVSEYLYFSD